MKDHSYLGSGKVAVREYRAAAPFIEIGNCSAANLSPQTNQLSLADHTQPGGGERNSVERLTGVELGITFHDFAPDNLKRFLRGSVTTTAAGNVIDENVVAYKGGITPLAKIATAITEVTGTSGSTTYSAGTDYEFREGALYIPETSTIPAPTGGAANIQVTYTNAAQSTVQALTSSSKHYEVLITGINEAQSGRLARVLAHKVSLGVLQQWALIGDDYGAGEVTSKLMSDSSRGAGESAYFRADLEDVV